MKYLKIDFVDNYVPKWKLKTNGEGINQMSWCFVSVACRAVPWRATKTMGVFLNGLVVQNSIAE